jgi:hypothetical protein
MLPSSCEKLCFNIIRIELADADGDGRHPRGRYTVVILFSETSMVVSGVVGYCTNLVASLAKLMKSVGEHVIYTLLPPHVRRRLCGDGPTVRLAVGTGASSPSTYMAKNNATSTGVS